MNSPQLNKVHLRALEPDDLDLLYAMENDPDLWTVGCQNTPYSKFTLANYIQTNSNDFFADRQARMVMALDDGTCIGLADVFSYQPAYGRAEVGIAVLNGYRRMGCAHQAIVALTDMARRFWHLHQLYALVLTTNQPAVALFSKAGFSANATLKDWFYDGEKYHDALLMQIFL